MKTTIIPALIGLALASPAFAQEPPRQSAQCLTEIASMTGERLDMFNPDLVAAAQRKADALYANVVRIIAARDAVEAAHVEAMVVLRREEAAGAAPEGAVVVADRDHREFQASRRLEDRVFAQQTPACQWPEGFGAEVSGS